MLLDLRSVARRLHTDEATVLHLVETGAVPAPLLIGERLVRWPVELLAEWARKGCPQGELLPEGEFMDARVLLVSEEAEREYRLGLLKRPEQIAEENDKVDTGEN